MPLWLQAGLWGLLSGGALVIGAAVGYKVRMSARAVAGVMAFGAGVLISALSFELVLEAWEKGGGRATVLGFAAGAVIYSLANWLLGKQGAKHRKRSGDQQASDSDAGGGGMAIALGALLDGIPESIAIGLSMLGGGSVSIATVVAIFISNFPAETQAATTALAAGAILAMLMDTMSPEAFEGTHAYATASEP